MAMISVALLVLALIVNDWRSRSAKAKTVGKKATQQSAKDRAAAIQESEETKTLMANWQAIVGSGYAIGITVLKMSIILVLIVWCILRPEDIPGIAKFIIDLIKS